MPPRGKGVKKVRALSCAEILSTGAPDLDLMCEPSLPRHQALCPQHQGPVPSRDLCAGGAAGHPGVLRLREVSGGGGRGQARAQPLRAPQGEGRQGRLSVVSVPSQGLAECRTHGG